MGRFVIVAYQPKPGKQPELLALVEKHLQVLRAENLVTARDACVMQAESGALIEVFEWRSSAAIDQAHANPVVQALWGEFAQACDYLPLANLAETQKMFAEFDAVGSSSN